MSKKYAADLGAAWTLTVEGKKSTVAAHRVVEAWTQVAADSPYFMKSLDMIKRYHHYSGGTEFGLQAFFKWRKPTEAQKLEYRRYYRVMKSDEVSPLLINWMCTRNLGLTDQTAAQYVHEHMWKPYVAYPRLVALRGDLVRL